VISILLYKITEAGPAALRFFTGLLNFFTEMSVFTKKTKKRQQKLEK